VPASTTFGTSLAGAVTAGWGATLWSLAAARDLDWPAVGRAVLIGVSAWFVLDAMVSVVTGFPGNVIPNLLFVALLVPPALGLAKGRSMERTALRTSP
jgi:hypothetical protein